MALVDYRYKSLSSKSVDASLKGNSLDVLNNILTIDVSPQFTKLRIGMGNNKFSLGNSENSVALLPEFDNYIKYSTSLSSSSTTPIYVEVGTHKRIVSSLSTIEKRINTEKSKIQKYIIKMRQINKTSICLFYVE